ncbi:MAG: glycoside hydrolase family 3 N-terminal domain-containing protein [Prolixibacteraceae bacterium]|jgi:beta-glucosidase-like glycosyl hydrolase/CubicO group peptidase (beta-lactamase class C family)
MKTETFKINFQVRMFSLIFTVLVIMISSLVAKAQINLDNLMQNQWVDSVFNSLTPDQRIGQLVWVDLSSNEHLSRQMEVAELIKNYDIGGIIYFKTSPEELVRQTNFYQSLAKTPLFVAIDAEWGVAMRLPGVIAFPYNMMMGASQNPELIKSTTAEMARQMKRLGIQVSLGPDCDVNMEAMNPIIGMRSFGQSPKQVAECSMAYVEGLQENGIIATAKHYPGHGDTKTDSHLTLPQVPYSRARLDSVELLPFRKLSAAGVGAVMTAHLNVPQLDAEPGIPSSLSSKIVKDILRKEWNYKGLIITDAMNMAGAKSFGKPGEIDVKALKAGNDVIEFPTDAVVTIKAIQKALQEKELSWDEINLKCRRVLAAKYWAGLNKKQVIRPKNLFADLNSPQAELLKRKMIEGSLTLLENKNHLIPLDRLDTLKIAALSVGDKENTTFQRMLANYTKVDFFNLPDKFTETDLDALKTKLKPYNLVIAGIHSLYESETRKSMQVGVLQMEHAKRPYGVTEELESLVEYLSTQKKSVLVYFANPYGLLEMKNQSKPPGLIMAYQNDTIVQSLSAQLIFGGIGAHGKLPVDIGNKYKMGDGIILEKPVRLKYSIPEDAGIQSVTFYADIDSIVDLALEKGAFPGCNILVAKDGKVILKKAYGYQTFDKRIPSRADDLYDLASVTKVTGGLPGILKLYDEGKIDLDKPVANYFPDWKNRLFHRSNKNDISVRELYAHQSGLVPFIGFYKQSLKNGKPSPKWYSIRPDESHSLYVAPGMYLENRFLKTVWRDIRKSPLKTRGKYVYSDLPLVITPQIVENVSGSDFRQFVYDNFYKPLGAYEVTYLPLQKFSRDKIVPTENDDYYRFQQLQGSVHDESAAVLGGVSGNAGVFASANDLGKLMQMYLQMGTYGGKQYVSEATMKEFTSVQFPQNNNHRGIIFDKPAINNGSLKPEDDYPCPEASPESFGHFGYTGTFVWMDPEYNLMYIFLSNRVYPTRNNNLISKMNIRTEILSAIYRNIKK